MFTSEEAKRIRNAKFTPEFLKSPEAEEAFREGADLAFGIDDSKDKDSLFYKMKKH